MSSFSAFVLPFSGRLHGSVAFVAVEIRAAGLEAATMTDGWVFKREDVEMLTEPGDPPDAVRFSVRFKPGSHEYTGLCYLQHRETATFLELFRDRDQWAEFVANALSERVRLLGFRGVFEELLAPGGLKLNVDEPDVPEERGEPVGEPTTRFTKADILQAITDQIAAWEERSEEGETESAVHLEQWLEPGALTAAMAGVLPDMAAELQDHARAHGGRVDMGQALGSVFAQGFLTGFQLGRRVGLD